MIPENVAVAMRFAQALWPHDLAPSSEAVLMAWSPALAPFPVDELCGCFERMSRLDIKFPSKSTVLAELESRRHREELLQDADQPRRIAPRKNAPVHPSALDYRVKLRREAVQYWRRADGTVAPEKLAEIDAWVAEVGERESVLLAKHGIDVSVTMPCDGRRGNVA